MPGEGLADEIQKNADLVAKAAPPLFDEHGLGDVTVTLEVEA